MSGQAQGEGAALDPSGPRPSAPNPDHYEDYDDGECSVCGGTGFIADTCTCGDDSCCCLYPQEEECDQCR